MILDLARPLPGALCKGFSWRVLLDSTGWAPDLLRFERDERSIEHEARLDGIYIIRTSEKKAARSAEGTVRTYKRSENAKKAFLVFLFYHSGFSRRQ